MTGGRELMKHAGGGRFREIFCGGGSKLGYLPKMCEILIKWGE